MKLRTVGILFSLVCAITLGSAKGNAVANEMKATKNEITAVVKDAVREQFELEAFEFGKHGKEDEGDDKLLEIFEEKIDFAVLDDIEKDPSNYDPIVFSDAIFSRLGARERDALDQYYRFQNHLTTKFERSYLSVIKSRTITDIDDYQEYAEEEFSEEIERTRGMTRAYYYTNHPQVYQGNQNSLINALSCLIPMWVIALMMGSVLVAAGAIYVPIFGQAIAAAAILALAAIIISLAYIMAIVLVEILKCIGEFLGPKIKKAFDGWARQIKGKVWDDNRAKSYSDVKNRFGNKVKWKDANDMDKALSKALKLAGTAISAATLKEKFKDDREFRVYLGKSSDKPNYVSYAAQDANGVAFSMLDKDWKDYENKGYIMWYLNLYFINLFATPGYEFRLCSNPSVYYNDGSYYGKELVHLRTCQSYYWSPVFTSPYISAEKLV